MLRRKLGRVTQLRLSKSLWFAYHRGEFWFRWFGRGLLFTNRRLYPATFSSRMKLHRTFAFGPYAISYLAKPKDSLCP